MNEISEGIKMAEDLLRTINAAKLKTLGKIFLHSCIMGAGIGGMLSEFRNLGCFAQENRDVTYLYDNLVRIHEEVVVPAESDEKETEE